MMALFIAAAAVAVERLINRRRLRLHEVLSDVGWLTLIFALIEFAWLYVVEAATLSYGAAVRPLWYTEWPVFKSLMFDAAAGVLLILTSVWLEAAGVRVELRRPRVARVTAVTHGRQEGAGTAGTKPQSQLGQKKCDIEWREAS
jgi:hypothetical protein